MKFLIPTLVLGTAFFLFSLAYDLHYAGGFCVYPILYIIWLWANRARPESPPQRVKIVDRLAGFFLDYKADRKGDY